MAKIKTTTISKQVNEILARPDFTWIPAFFEQFTHGEIHLVGGTVRDLIIGRETADFDFVISKVKGRDLEDFLKKYGEVNLVGKSFGVFVFMPKGSKFEEALELALPRTEKSFKTGGYHDFDIHTDPDLPIEEDLKRRDFTINAIAYNIKTEELADPFDGIKDIEKKIIRAVGDPKERFEEDYTRMLRAIRFAAQLDFIIEKKTLAAIKKFAPDIMSMSPERIQHELNKIMLSQNVEYAFELMKETGIVNQILPEIAEGIDVHQGKAHIYNVYTHLVKAADFASKKEHPLHVIMAALFHDSGKPRTKEGSGDNTTFYQHEYVGEKMSRDALNRLKYPREFTKKVSHLVRNHMFYYSMGEVTDSGVRRLIAKVGSENVDDLIRLRMSDRIGMGRPKAKPFKLQELERRIKLLQTDPVTVEMLAVDGNDLMSELGVEPGPRIKHLKNAMLSLVLDDPSLNEKDVLMEKVKELNKKSDDELAKMSPDFNEIEKERRKEVLKGFKGVE